MEQLRMIHKLNELPEQTLAEGFTLRQYVPGDETAWVEICMHGLLGEADCDSGWDKCIVAMKALVPERDVWFVCDREGKPVATCASFEYADNVGLIHMLAAKPEARGNRLAYSMTAHALHRLDKVLYKEGRMVRLRSDDWRLSAVRAYLLCGFQPVLFDEGMQERWTAICDKLGLHGIEMLDDEGKSTGVIL